MMLIIKINKLASNKSKQPSLFKGKSVKPSDETVKNKLQEVQPQTLKIATMGVMNTSKYSNKNRLLPDNYYLKEENDKTKENFDNISNISN